MGAMKANKVGTDLMKAALVAVVALVSTGCGKVLKQKEFEGLSCGASDQVKSFMNPMDATIVQTVTIDPNFSASEIAKIQSAIDTWNVEGVRSTGHEIFRAQVLSVSAQSVPSNAQDCGFPGASGAFSIVKVTSSSTWTNLGFTASNPGVTIRCASGSEYAEKQVVLLNTTNMASMPNIFESVILHELGHAIGLDHSCDMTNSKIPGFAGCSAAGTDPSYIEAVMYPYVSATNTKEDLRRNDEERATCALNYRP